MSRAAVQQIRSIYLHTGPRVAGLRRDPKEVFQTFSGAQYGISEPTLKHVKGFLADKYAIPDEMVLQAITHKSFGNGIKPYNEKLSAMGLKLLNLYFAKHVLQQETTNELAINGKNLDVLGTPMAKELGGRMAMGVFAKNAKLTSVMFWKLYNHLLSFELSGEMKVSAQMMYALVGAVNFVHGKKVAEEFVREKFLLGSSLIESITQEIIEQA